MDGSQIVGAYAGYVPRLAHLENEMRWIPHSRCSQHASGLRLVFGTCGLFFSGVKDGIEPFDTHQDAKENYANDLGFQMLFPKEWSWWSGAE
jgi:hypothetical protein